MTCQCHVSKVHINVVGIGPSGPIAQLWWWPKLYFGNPVHEDVLVKSPVMAMATQ